jgi:hypothetical protein
MKTSPEKALGVMQLDTRFPRIPGDVSHPDSYEFPIIVKVVTGANFKKAEQADNPEILALFLEAAMELEAQGVFAHHHQLRFSGRVPARNRLKCTRAGLFIFVASNSHHPCHNSGPGRHRNRPGRHFFRRHISAPQACPRMSPPPWPVWKTCGLSEPAS